MGEKMISYDELRITGVHLYPTYLGLLVGVPDEDMNNDIIGEAKEKAATLYSGPVYLAEPKMTFVLIENGTHTYQSPRLPGYTVIADLETFEIEDSYDGRMLTLVFFVDDISKKPIRQIVWEEVQKLDWNAHSKLWRF